MGLALPSAIRSYVASAPPSDAILNKFLLRRLPHYVPGINPQAVLAVDTADIKDAYDRELLRRVRQAYLDGLNGGWTLGMRRMELLSPW